MTPNQESRAQLEEAIARTRIQGPIEHDVGPFKQAQRYRALDQDALVWVQATLFDTAARARREGR